MVSLADLATTIARIDAVTAGDVCARTGCWTPVDRAVSPWCTPACAHIQNAVRKARFAALVAEVRRVAPFDGPLPPVHPRGRSFIEPITAHSLDAAIYAVTGRPVYQGLWPDGFIPFDSNAAVAWCPHSHASGNCLLPDGHADNRLFVNARGHLFPADVVGYEQATAAQLLPTDMPERAELLGIGLDLAAEPPQPWWRRALRRLR